MLGMGPRALQKKDELKRIRRTLQGAGADSSDHDLLLSSICSGVHRDHHLEEHPKELESVSNGGAGEEMSIFEVEM